MTIKEHNEVDVNHLILRLRKTRQALHSIKPKTPEFEKAYSEYAEASRQYVEYQQQRKRYREMIESLNNKPAISTRVFKALFYIVAFYLIAVCVLTAGNMPLYITYALKIAFSIAGVVYCLWYIYNRARK